MNTRKSQPHTPLGGVVRSKMFFANLQTLREVLGCLIVQALSHATMRHTLKGLGAHGDILTGTGKRVLKILLG
jgi:hypothetical protein